MRKEKTIAGGALGIFLLMILAILLLSIFGALTMSSAYADLRLADKFKDNTQNYYKADSEAQRLIAHIDGVIIGAGDKTSDGEFLAAVAENAEKLSGVKTEEEEGAMHIYFSVKISENQQLFVKLYTDFDIKSTKRYAIEEYVVQNLNDQDYGEKPIDVWDGTIKK